MSTPAGLESLLVEDNPSDAELSLRELKRRNRAVAHLGLYGLLLSQLPDSESGSQSTAARL